MTFTYKLKSENSKSPESEKRKHRNTGGAVAVDCKQSTGEMEKRNYIPPNALTLRQNLPPLIHPPPPHSVTRDITTTVHHRQKQLLFIENQRLAAFYVSLSQELSAAQRDLRHLSAAAVEVKAERDAQVREMYARAVEMEAEVKLIDESNDELARIVIDLRKLRLEKKELDEKLNKLRRDVVKVSDEWNQIPVVKLEIEKLQKEIERGRKVIEHEKRVHASNIKQSQSMEDYKILLAGEIMNLQLESIDAGKRARAAAAAEAVSIPGNLKFEGSSQG